MRAIADKSEIVITASVRKFTASGRPTKSTMWLNVADARLGALRGPSMKIGRDRTCGPLGGTVAWLENSTSIAV